MIFDFRKTRHRLLILGFLILVVFVFFSRSVRQKIWNSTDLTVTVKIQDRIDKSVHLRVADFVGNTMEGASFFAAPEFSVFFVGLLTLVAVTDIRHRKFRLRGLIIPVAFLLVVLAEIYGKTVIHHPAPPFYMIKNPVSVFPKYYINEQYSYPSGHAARAVFMALSLFLVTIKPGNHIIMKCRMGVLVGSVGLIYIALVSLSRIYLGHHWFSDVIGGWLIGVGISILEAAILV